MGRFFNQGCLILWVLCGMWFLVSSCAPSERRVKHDLGIDLPKESVERKAATREIQSGEEKNAKPNYLVLARTLTAKGFYDVALGQLKEAEKIGGKNAEIFYLRGICLRKKGKQEEALSQFKEAISAAPEYSYAYAGLAMTYDGTGEHAKAEACYDKAIQIDPGVFSFYNDFGVSLMAQGKFKEAIQMLEKGIALNPDSRRAVNNLGLAYAMLGKDDRAFHLFLKGESRACAYNNMGYVRQMRGEKRQALEMYRKALELDPHLTAAKQNLKALERALSGLPPEGDRKLEGRDTPGTAGDEIRQ